MDYRVERYLCECDIWQTESLEDLQKMFVEMVGGDGMCFDFNTDPTAAKRSRSGASKGNNVAVKRSSSCC